MNYVQLHLGDWIAGTLDLTPTERGVYMDLLVRYYKEERPLMQDECKRIARGYAPVEQEAMQYVLQRFFTLDEAGYHQARCDEEIKKAQAVSTKRKNAAASRWAKKPDSDASAYPNAEQMESTCNANGILTINPLTNNQENNKKEEDACVCAGMGEEDNAFRLESPEADEKAQASKRKTPEAATHLFDLPDLPDDWREYCREVRPDLDPDRMFAEFKFYWQKGNGKGKLRSDKGWAQSWQNWIRGDRSQPAPATFVNRRPAPRSVPSTDMPQIDYHKGINPDGSF